MDVFAEVKRIEDGAERLLSEARAAGEEAVKKARDEAERYRAQARAKFEGETARLKAEQQKKIAEGVAAVEADFRARRTRVEEAARNAHALADWVAARFLRDNE